MTWNFAQSNTKNALRTKTRTNFGLQLAYAIRRTGCVSLIDLATVIVKKRKAFSAAQIAKNLSLISNGGGTDVARQRIFLLLVEVAGGRAPKQFREQQKQRKFLPSRLAKSFEILKMESAGDVRSVRRALQEKEQKNDTQERQQTHSKKRHCA